VQLKKKKTLSYLKGLNKRAHWEAMKGSLEQNQKYCSKESSLEGVGELDEPCKKKNRDAMVKAILAGEKNESKLAREFGGTYLSVYKGVQHLINLVDQEAHPIGPPCLPWEKKETRRYITWLYGDSGCGKDYRVQAFNSMEGRSLYTHDASQGLWFDNYRGEEAILFSDFGGHQMKYSTWKDLFDPMRESFSMQVKGKTGGVIVKATHVYFTTQDHPIETWKSLREKENNWKQVERRLASILLTIEHVEGPDCLEKGYFEMKGQEVPERPSIGKTGWTNPSYKPITDNPNEFLS